MRSSLDWCGSLSFNNYNNNVSRITESVLRRPSIRFLCHARRAHQIECPIPSIKRTATRMPGSSSLDMD